MIMNGSISKPLTPPIRLLKYDLIYKCSALFYFFENLSIFKGISILRLTSHFPLMQYDFERMTYDEVDKLPKETQFFWWFKRRKWLKEQRKRDKLEVNRLYYKLKIEQERKGY